MRKNSKPLKLWIDPMLGDYEEIKTIIGKGHEIVLSGDADVMIGPKCWRIDPALGHLDKQLTMMIEGVRNIKWPKPKKEEKND